MHFLSKMVAVACVLSLGANTSRAAQTIVALGASNTEGYGVGKNESFPAQLEALLKQKGYDVRVINAGISGDTTSGMLGRLATAVPDGTKLVILQPGGNDAFNGISPEQREANIQQISKRLEARGAKTLRLDQIASWQDFPKDFFQDDGIHLTPRGYARIAEKLMPAVIAALGPRD